jgi:hypothetical protein
MAPHKNFGEIGELLLKAKALQCMQSGEIVPAIAGAISSIHVGDFKSERGTFSTKVSCPSIGNLASLCDSNYKELQLKLAYLGIVKAGTSMKADIQINGINYSIKSSEKRPAIINHTFRRGFLRITRKLGIPIQPLDEQVASYWDVRQSDKFKLGEDISGYDRRNASIFISPDFKEYFRPIFNYFAFTGTGRSDSPAPAEYILEFDDPTDISTWRVIPKDSFYDQAWPNLIFSVRDKLSKGQRLSASTMPPEDKPWAQISRGKIQAQLHVRAG